MKTPVQNPLRFLVPTLSLLCLLLTNNARAAIQYWDPTGTTVSATPSGSFEGANWARTSTMATPGVLYTNSNLPVFSAGTGATGAFTVTANANHTIGGMYNGNGASAVGGTVIVNGTGTLTIASGNQGFQVSSGKFLTISNVLAGTGVLAAESTGQLYLNGTNIWTGGALLGYPLSNPANPWSGIINYNNNASFGTGTITLATNSTATSIGALVAEGSSAITIANKFTTTSTNIFNLNIDGGSGGTTFSGTWALPSTLNLGSSVAAHLVTISGVISGAGTLRKFNSGTLKLSGANTFAGGLIISNGTVQLGANGGIPSGTGKGLLTILQATAGIFDVNAFTGTVNGLAGTGTVTNSSATTGTLVVGAADTSSTFDGIIKGGLNLAKTGIGSFTLTGANTYTGATTVSNGVLTANSVNVIPVTSPVTVAGPGTLDLNFQNDTFLSLSGSGAVSNDNSSFTVNGNLSTNSASSYSCFGGSMQGGGTLIKDGTHAMALRQTNIPVNFLNGTLSVGAVPNCLPTNTDFTVPTGALFQLDAGSQTLDSLAGSGTVNLGGGTLTLIGFSGNTSFGGVIQNSELAGSSTALGHGLRGYYYDNADFTSLVAIRDDSTVNLTSTTNLPAPLLPNTNWVSVRWLGQVLSTVAGTYTFTTTSDDGQRLWVNGTLLVDDWAGHGATAKSGTITLAANTRYDIVMEYYNGTSDGSTKLAWTPPGDTVSTVIPTDYLFLPGAGQLVFAGGFSTLSGPSNTYSGGTYVTGGTLEANTDGAMGKGNVNLSNGTTLHFYNGTTNGFMSPSADLVMTGATSVVNLDFFGPMTIHGFSTNGGVSYLPPGTYGPSGAHQVSQITSGGGGYLNVTGILPANVLTSSTSSSVYGSSINFTSTITGSGGTPTGTVTFYDGASAIGTVPLVGGVATLAVSDLSTIYSPHSVTAVYSGDATYDQSTSSALTQTVTPLPLTLGSLSVSNKVYDTTTNANITVAGSTALVGVLPGDTNFVHLTGTAAFIDKTAANGKTVNITGITLAGSLAGNYSLAQTTTTATANITPATILVTNVTASDKVYDGTSNAVINATSATIVSGVQGSDDVAVNPASGVGDFNNAAVGTLKKVTITNLTFTGADGGNYLGTAITTNNITKASTTNNLVSSANPSTLGDSVTFTFTPAPIPPGAGIPTGNVIFLTNSVAFSTNALASGAATSTATAILPIGTNTIIAQYAGDANFIGNTNTLNQVVNDQIVVATNITVSLIGTNVVLTWPGTHTLQTSTNIPLNWTDLPTATSPYTNTSTNFQGYFQLKN